MPVVYSIDAERQSIESSIQEVVRHVDRSEIAELPMKRALPSLVYSVNSHNNSYINTLLS